MINHFMILCNVSCPFEKLYCKIVNVIHVSHPATWMSTTSGQCLTDRFLNNTIINMGNIRITLLTFILYIESSQSCTSGPHNPAVTTTTTTTTTACQDLIPDCALAAHFFLVNPALAQQLCDDGLDAQCPVTCSSCP